MNISKYLKISNESMSICSIYTSSDQFKICYERLIGFEQKSLISHIIVNNTPFVFKDIPLLYEQIIQYMSALLNIEAESIKLIGSAKTGFSVTPPPNYGKLFSKKSDLDFAIINEIVFNKLCKEYSDWEAAYSCKKISPKTNYEKECWDNNIVLLKKNIDRGFIDTYKIPNREMCSVTKSINNAMYLIPLKLNEYYNIKVSKASVRVYKSHDLFWKQLKLNTDQILNNKQHKQDF